MIAFNNSARSSRNCFRWWWWWWWWWCVYVRVFVGGGGWGSREGGSGFYYFLILYIPAATIFFIFCTMSIGRSKVYVLFITKILLQGKCTLLSPICSKSYGCCNSISALRIFLKFCKMIGDKKYISAANKGFWNGR